MKPVWEACDCDNVKSQYYRSMNIYVGVAITAGIAGLLQLGPTIAFCCQKPKIEENLVSVNDQSEEKI